jgi:hypothetical protein
VAVASFSSDDIYLINIKTMTLTKTIKVSTTVHGEFIAVYYGTLTWLSATSMFLTYKMVLFSVC